MDKNEMMKTDINEAIEQNDIDAVRTLLESGAYDPNTYLEDDPGNYREIYIPMLCYAIKYSKSFEMAKLLVKYGADVNADGTFLITDGSEDEIDKKLYYGYVYDNNSEDGPGVYQGKVGCDGRTALYYALCLDPIYLHSNDKAYEDNICAIVELLLKKGCDANHMFDGKSPLYYAILRHQSKRLIQLLLDHGASWYNLFEVKRYNKDKKKNETAFRIAQMYLPFDDMSKIIPDSSEKKLPKELVDFLKEKGWKGYGVRFGDIRRWQDTFREHPCIMYIDSYEIIPNMNMCYDHEFVQCRVLCDDGTILDVRDEDEAKDIKKSMQKNNQGLRYHYVHSTGTLNTTDTFVREDHWEEFQSLRKRGRTSFRILQMMSEKENEG